MDRSADRMEGERLSGAHVLDIVVGMIRRDGCHVVAVRGELDLYTGPPVRRVFEEIATEDPGACVIVDLHHTFPIFATVDDAVTTKGRRS